MAQILTPSALDSQQEQVELVKTDAQHLEYVHAVKVNAVTMSEDKSSAQIQAEVKEEVRGYRNAQPDEELSRNENLQLIYDVVLQDGRWLVDGWTVEP